MERGGRVVAREERERESCGARVLWVVEVVEVVEVV